MKQLSPRSTTTEAQVLRLYASQQEMPLQCPLNTTKSRSHSLQLEKTHAKQQRLSAAKNKLKKKFLKEGDGSEFCLNPYLYHRRSKSTYNKNAYQKLELELHQVISNT